MTCREFPGALGHKSSRMVIPLCTSSSFHMPSSRSCLHWSHVDLPLTLSPGLYGIPISQPPVINEACPQMHTMGIPISLVLMYISGQMTERAA